MVSPSYSTRAAATPNLWIKTGGTRAPLLAHAPPPARASPRHTARLPVIVVFDRRDVHLRLTIAFLCGRRRLVVESDGVLNHKVEPKEVRALAVDVRHLRLPRELERALRTRFAAAEE